MDEDPKSKSWWNTLPGVLTAVAAVIAAVTALVSTLHQTGWIGAKAPTSLSTATGTAVASTPTSTPPPNPTPAAPATPGSIALPAQTTFSYGKLSYQILSARVAHPTPDTLSLRFTIRMTSDDQYEANFWDASFRLRVNGVLQAPVSNLNKVVAGNSSTDGVVEFVVPSGTAQVELQMGEVGNGKPGVAMVLPAG
ncbi:hypothetical protein [Rhodoferax sp.]|uniref:hypothetical protein n=1 Tax=Rhodoferax sp. TaxID=50421 RepID=UPI0025F0F91E|nr:hypothetical protein [Rhodoferax sp.]